MEYFVNAPPGPQAPSQVFRPRLPVLAFCLVCERRRVST